MKADAANQEPPSATAPLRALRQALYRGRACRAKTPATSSAAPTTSPPADSATTTPVDPITLCSPLRASSQRLSRQAGDELGLHPRRLVRRGRLLQQPAAVWTTTRFLLAPRERCAATRTLNDGHGALPRDPVREVAVGPSHVALHHILRIKPPRRHAALGPPATQGLPGCPRVICGVSVSRQPTRPASFFLFSCFFSCFFFFFFLIVVSKSHFPTLFSEFAS